MVYRITHDDELLALIVTNKFSDPGINFFTPASFSQQLGYLRHPAGKIIPAHVHNPVAREVHYTQEVLFIKSGKLRVDFFDRQQNYLESYILEAGDTILLASGGHGFEVLEDIEMIEVKQGPYSGDSDKTRFNGSIPSGLKFHS
jgi:hypothetical protein